MNRPLAPLTPATALTEHPATRRPIPWAPRPCHWCSAIVSPPAEHHRRGDTSVVSLHPLYHHPWAPLGLGFLPGTTSSGESPPVGWNRPAQPRWRRSGGLNPQFQSAGPKGFVGPDHFCWVGHVHCGPSLVAQWCLLFFHPIYSNQFNSNSNLVWTLEIRRSLTKFNKSMFLIL
jgi:hypothetical protein